MDKNRPGLNFHVQAIHNTHCSKKNYARATKHIYAINTLQYVGFNSHVFFQVFITCTMRGARRRERVYIKKTLERAELWRCTKTERDIKKH